MTGMHRPVNGEAGARRNYDLAQKDRASFDKLVRPPVGDARLRKVNELRTEFAKRAYEVAENKRAVTGLDAKFADLEARLDWLAKVRAQLAESAAASPGLPAAAAGEDDDTLEIDVRRLLRKH